MGILHRPVPAHYKVELNLINHIWGMRRGDRQFLTQLATAHRHKDGLARIISTDSRGGALGKRRIRISRIGGWPKKRLYSPLN